MAKDRTVNPATAALKAAKKRDIKKGKASVDKQRAERLAKRNPFRIQQQIDELKQAQSAGTLRPKDRQLLEQLEKEHKAILRAREQLGDKAPEFRAPRQERDDGGGGGLLGKRKRRVDDDGRRSDESETDDDVKDIPMPKDVENMPPAPRRKPRYNASGAKDVDLSLPKRPEVKSQAVYESAPMIKDLRKEAVKAFVPSSVARNIKQVKGDGGRLLEPEELDRLEKGGYRDAEGPVDEAVKEAEYEMVSTDVEGQYNEENIADRQLRHVRGTAGERAADLETEGYRDADMAATEAVKEA
jgi:hypothetical protein